MDATTSYFLKKYYPHVIKWWLVIYNPEAKRIWPSKKEEEAAMRLEKKKPKRLSSDANSSAFNATTGSYSGLYGQKPVDDSTKAAYEQIMNKSAQSNQKNVDSLLNDDAFYTDNNVAMSPEQQSIINEANTIYERLQREAAEDDAKRLAEIELARLRAANATA